MLSDLADFRDVVDLRIGSLGAGHTMTTGTNSDSFAFSGSRVTLGRCGRRLCVCHQRHAEEQRKECDIFHFFQGHCSMEGRHRDQIPRGLRRSRLPIVPLVCRSKKSPRSIACSVPNRNPSASAARAIATPLFHHWPGEYARPARHATAILRDPRAPLSGLPDVGNQSILR